MANIKFLVRRFAGPVIAVYLLNLGVWLLLLVVTQFVMFIITKAVNGFAELLGSFSFVEGVAVSARFLPMQLADGVVPIILGLLVGWWVWRRKTIILRSSL